MQAGRHLAKAMAIVGVDVVVALLLKKAIVKVRQPRAHGSEAADGTKLFGKYDPKDAAKSLPAEPAGTAGTKAPGTTSGVNNVVTATELNLTAEQLQNIRRFEKKLPANAKDTVSVRSLPNGGVAVQGTSAGRVPGSSAVYEKQIDAAGNTIQSTKTTYDPAGSIVHVKDKLDGSVFP